MTSDAATWTASEVGCGYQLKIAFQSSFRGWTGGCQKLGPGPWNASRSTLCDCLKSRTPAVTQTVSVSRRAYSESVAATWSRMTACSSGLRPARWSRVCSSGVHTSLPRSGSFTPICQSKLSYTLAMVVLLVDSMGRPESAIIQLYNKKVKYIS